MRHGETSSMTKTLPNKPSDLAELVLRDMRKAIRSPLYHIDMSVFHVPNKTCAVCAAGSVMAFTLNGPHDEHQLPGNFPEPTKRKLYAIDHLRTGNMGAAFAIMDRSSLKGEQFTRVIANYDEHDRKPFFRDMRQLIKDLRAAGY